MVEDQEHEDEVHGMYVDEDGVIRVDLTECDRSNEGHAWFRCEDPGRWDPYRKFFTRWVSQCARCNSYRYRGINAYGEIEATWYDYSPAIGWKDRWGVGNTRPSAAEIRYARLPKKGRRKRRS